MDSLTDGQIREIAALAGCVYIRGSVTDPASDPTRWIGPLCDRIRALESEIDKLNKSHEIWQEWELVKEACKYSGVRLEFIPIDPKPYCVAAIYPDSCHSFERSESELIAIRQAVQCFKEVNAKMTPARFNKIDKAEADMANDEDVKGEVEEKDGEN